MVNTGKPSHACAICKQRKIKCDLAKPACSQCIKSGWTCPGPRDGPDVTFKDQTDIVTRNSGRDGLPAQQGTDLAIRAQGILVQTTSTSTFDRGIAFFMHQYVFLGDIGSVLSTNRGHHEYLLALMRQEGANGPLKTIIAAAGLAALSNAGNARTWEFDSYRLCNEAIRQLKTALESAAEPCVDSVLAAIMLMGTFEAITSGDGVSMRFYRNHTMAAARCIELRGPKQFESPTSLKLFLEMRRIVLMTCHQLQIPQPHAMDKWSKWAEQVQRPEDLDSNRFAEINVRLAAVRAEIRTSGITSPNVVSAMLLPIDKQLVRWKQDLPESWSYRTCWASDVDSVLTIVWQARYDIYIDFWAVAVLNSYLCVRLIIHEAIIKSGSVDVSAEYQDLLRTSGTTLKEIVDEICYSVPYLLGYGEQDFQNAQRSSDTPSDSHPIPGGYVLVWPLFLAGMTRTTSRPQRNWLGGILRHIGLRMGLRLAMSMATVLAKCERTLSDGETWLNGDFNS